MITFGEYLTEARMAPLYHATSHERAYKIIKDGYIMGITAHDKKMVQGKTSDEYYTHGVSLTRSFHVAKTWVYPEVIFEFDQLRINQNHKIQPVQYWNKQTSGARKTYSSKGKYQYNYGNEDEEFFIGKKLDLKFVTKIYVTSGSGGDDVSIAHALKEAKLNIPVVKRVPTF